MSDFVFLFRNFWNLDFRQEQVVILIENPQENIALFILTFIIIFISEAIGQAILFIMNKLNFRRILLSTLAIGITNTLTFGIYLLIFVLLLQFLGINVEFRVLLGVISFSFFPRILSFLGIMPYFGEILLKLIQLFSYYLLVWISIEIWDLEIVPAILSIGIGFVSIFIIRSTIGRPLEFLEDKILNLASGKKFKKYKISQFLNNLINNDN